MDKRIRNTSMKHLLNKDYFELIRTVDKNLHFKVWKKERIEWHFFKEYCAYCIEKYYNIDIKQIDIYTAKKTIDDFDFVKVFNLPRRTFLNLFYSFANNVYLYKKFIIDDLLTFIYGEVMKYEKWIVINFEKTLNKKNGNENNIVYLSYKTIFDFSNHLINLNVEEKRIDEISYLLFEKIAEKENFDLGDDEQIIEYFERMGKTKKTYLDELMFYYDTKYYFIYKMFNINMVKERFEKNCKSRTAKNKMYCDDLKKFIDLLYNMDRDADATITCITLRHELFLLKDLIIENIKEFRKKSLEEYYEIIETIREIKNIKLEKDKVKNPEERVEILKNRVIEIEKNKNVIINNFFNKEELLKDIETIEQKIKDIKKN